MPLIHGKQIRLNTLKEELLLVTGATATNGEILSYDAGSGGFAWVTNTGGVSSVTAGPGISGNTTTGDITLVADVDNSSIFLDESNQISLGNPTTGDIGFPASNTYRFVGGSNHVIFEGDFTVNGTTTFINTDNLAVKDNIIVINSGSTVGFGTAGISVDLGNGSFSDVLWHEANGGYWGIDNPDGSGATQTYPILTTASLETGSTAVSIVQGTGTDIDKITIDVIESNLSGIPNSSLVNDNFSVTNDGVVTASTSVALGGTLDVGLADDSILEVHLNTTNAPTDNFILSYDSGSNGFTWVDVGSVTNDNYVSGGSVTYTGPAYDNNSLTLNRTGGLSDVIISNLQDTYVTGGTHSLGTITFGRNDGGTFQVTGLDSTDTFSTGTTNTVAATNSSNTQSTDITGNDGFTDFTVSLTDTFVTGGTHNAGTLTFTKNDGDTFQVTGLDSTDTFSTGGTITVTPDNNSESGTIGITGNGGFTPYNITGVNDTFLTGGTLTGTNIVLDQNSGNQITIDLSSLDVNDTYASGGTVTNGTINIELNDATNFNLTGNVVQSVTGENGVTATTSNGAVTVGLDYSTTLQAVPTTKDKLLTVTATTSGNFYNTGIKIDDTPARDGYVGVSVNGVWYIVGDGSRDPDIYNCYFSDDGGATALAIKNIVADTPFFWNGNGTGFQLDNQDNVAFYYDIIQ